MRCIVRRRKTDIETPEVFVPKGMTAEELLRILWEKEKVILSAIDEIDEESSICGKEIAVVETVNECWTEFQIRTIVEVEK